MALTDEHVSEGSMRRIRVNPGSHGFEDINMLEDKTSDSLIFFLNLSEGP